MEADYIPSLQAAAKLIAEFKAKHEGLSDANWKEDLASLTSLISGSQVEVAQAQRQDHMKEMRIAELEERLKLCGDAVKLGDAYFFLKDGVAHGAPLCLRCRETDGAFVHLTKATSAEGSCCPSCKTTYANIAAIEAPDA